MLNAILYMARSGGGWRMLPMNFGPWQTVYWWFRRFIRRLLFPTSTTVRRCSTASARVARQPEWRRARQPDSQGPGAQDGAARRRKKDRRPQAPIAVDTDGRLFMVDLTTADVSDSAGAQLILDGVRKQWPWSILVHRRRVCAHQAARQSGVPRIHP